jgi:hypothetical protein
MRAFLPATAATAHPARDRIEHMPDSAAIHELCVRRMRDRLCSCREARVVCRVRLEMSSVRAAAPGGGGVPS